MKIFVATDLEGTNGVFSFEQSRDAHGSPANIEALRLQLEEVNAAACGAFDGGAQRVVVAGLQGHGGPISLESLEERVEVILGAWGQATRDALLDAKFDAVFFLGFHAMSNTPGGVLCHTGSSKHTMNVWINDHLAGELEQNAIKYGGWDIPVVLVTGDDHTCQEATDLLGESVVTVEVKRGLAREGAWMPSPKRARKLIQEGARKAMGLVGKAKPYQVEFPLTIRHQFVDSGAVDRHPLQAGEERIDATTIQRVVNSVEEMG